MSAVRTTALDFYGKDIEEPRPWPRVEGDRRREPVLDLNFHPPRLVRYVGWRRCLACPKYFWSSDVIRVRLCDCCKSYKTATTTDLT